MLNKMTRFVRRALKQDVFYSTVELLCFFGMSKNKAFNYAIRILESIRIRDRWKRRSFAKRLPQPKLTISSKSASAHASSREIDGLQVLEGAVLDVIKRNKDFADRSVKAALAECHRKKTAPNIDLLRVKGKPGSYEMDNVEDFKEIFQALAHQDLFSIAANYLGAAPVLMSISLVYTPKNDTLLGSQLYHAHSSFDYDKPKEIGLVMNLSDVTLGSGPFTYIPADLGLPAIRDKSLWTGSRITDEALFSAIGKNTSVALTGPVGETLFVDGSRCIHQGGRSETDDRFVLIAFYSLPHLHGLPSKSMLAMSNKMDLRPQTDLELLLLRE